MQEGSLAALSFDAAAENKRFQEIGLDKATHELTRNFMAYDNEVIKDSPVSIRYSYWFDRFGHAYTDSSLAQEFRADSQIDPEERDGMTLSGFHLNSQTIYQNPGKVVLWYSPPGQASFSGDSETYKDIKYVYGQLYVQHFDGKELRALALKVNDEEAVDEFMGDSPRFINEQARIHHFLHSPKVTDFTSINALVNSPWNNVKIYHDKDEKQHYLAEVIEQIKKTFGNGSNSQYHVELAKKALSEGSEKGLFDGYVHMVWRQMEMTGKNYAELSGSCGGKEISRTSVEAMLGLSSPIGKNLYSSQIRSFSVITESLYYNNYECPHCHATIQGERKDVDSSQWKKSCPSCQGALNCA